MEESKNISINGQSQICLDNITRCPECNLISSLKSFYKEGKPIIHYFCENNHKGDIYLDEYIIKYNSNSLLKQKCEACNKSQNEVKGQYFYCCKCKKFLCHSCILNHEDDEKYLIFLKRYDSFCKIHANNFDNYCLKCKKNICVICKPQHESHDILDLSTLIYNEESKKNIEETLKNFEKNIKELDVIKEEIISKIDELKKSSELQMKFFKILISTYKYQENQTKLNYDSIQNLKSFEEIIRLNVSKIYESILKEGKNYISFLQNIRESIGQTNL